MATVTPARPGSLTSPWAARRAKAATPLRCRSWGGQGRRRKSHPWLYHGIYGTGLSGYESGVRDDGRGLHGDDGGVGGNISRQTLIPHRVPKEPDCRKRVHATAWKGSLSPLAETGKYRT